MSSDAYFHAMTMAARKEREFGAKLAATADRQHTSGLTQSVPADAVDGDGDVGAGAGGGGGGASASASASASAAPIPGGGAKRPIGRDVHSSPSQ